MTLHLDETGLHSEVLDHVILAHQQTHTRITLDLPAGPQELSGLWRGQWSVIANAQAIEIVATKNSALIVEGYDETLTLTKTNDGLIDVSPAATVTISGRSAGLNLKLNFAVKSSAFQGAIPSTQISLTGINALSTEMTTDAWVRKQKSQMSTDVLLRDIDSATTISAIVNRAIVVTLTINGRHVRTRTQFSGVKFVPDGSVIGWQLRYRKLSPRGRKLAYFFARLLPTSSNTFFFQSYLARALSDSPRALYEYISRSNSSARLVWSVNDVNIPLLPNTVAVRPGSFAHYFYLARSKFIISNTGLADGFEKRKSQIHLQTWHGSPVKRVGRDKGIADEQRVVRGAGDTKKLTGFARRVSMWDYLIAANSLSAKAFSTAWRFGGEMLCMGYPRNDDLLDSEWVALKRAEVRTKLNIPADHTVALWAPTWTDDAPMINGRRLFTLPIDLNEVAQTKNLTILVKLHYLVANQLDDSGLGVKFINVSDWDDVNDLFPASDVLISDFSGVIPDYSLTEKPIIIYAPHFDEYLETRGTYVDLEVNGPGPVVRTESELLDRLSDLRWHSEFSSQYEAFAAIYREYETGHAAQSVYDRVVHGGPPQPGHSSK